MLWTLSVTFLLMALAIAGLVVAGRRANAGRVRSAIAIDRPAATIWPWLTEPAKLTRWVGWLEEVRELDPGDAEGVGELAIFVMNDPQMKETVEIETRVIAAEAPHRLELRFEAPVGYVGALSYVLEDSGESSTQLICDGRYALVPALARLMEPVVTRQARLKLRGDLARLRDIIHGEATADLADPAPTGRTAEAAEAAPPPA